MAQITDRQKNSEIIARLIYRAHVQPAPPVIDMEYDASRARWS